MIERAHFHDISEPAEAIISTYFMQLSAARL